MYTYYVGSTKQSYFLFLKKGYFISFLPGERKEEKVLENV